ncbi:unnamed protein product [Rhodiola kirilowii]
MAGIVSVRLRMEDGQEVLLPEVRYVPELKRNLISLGMLDKQGYTFKAENGTMKVTKGLLIIMKGVRMNGIYVLLGNTIVGAVVNYTKNANIDIFLWHLRLGHGSEKGICKLHEQGNLGNGKLGNLDFCENCVLGKSSRVKFNKAIHRTTDILDYIHSDLWGPTRTESHSGKRYFITSIDDFSRRVWIYFLAKKSEAFQTFKTWKNLVENQTGKHIKRLRTDNGLEYLDKEFLDFCKCCGIAKHHTVAGTPQQNGLAERYNRTILERVRCLMLQSGMPKSFWAEAANTACYLINRCPSAAIDFNTPMKMWSSHPVDYNLLRIFGCCAYAHVKRDKLEPRALKCVFLGYQEGVKGYKLWYLEKNHKRTLISRDVVFKEQDFLFKKTNVEKSPEQNPSIEFEVQEPSGTSTEVEQGGVKIQEHGRTEPPAPNPTDQNETGQTDIENSPRSLQNYTLVRDRERRTHKKPVRYGYEDVVDFAFSVTADVPENEPKTVKEALNSEHGDLWYQAMQDEINSLHKNNTWKLVKKPHGVKVVDSKWVFRYKEGIPWVEKPRCKARLCAKGFTQREGIDFNEIYAPVVKHGSIRMVLSLVAHADMELEQLDMKTAFLYGDLDETIYLKQPELFSIGNTDIDVCLQNKSPYGLKQSPRQWYKKFDEFMLGCDFKRSSYDWCIYFKFWKNGSVIYLLLYVDDMLIASNNMQLIIDLKEQLNSKFEMKDLGHSKKILGMHIERDRSKKTLFLNQTEPNLAHSVSAVSKYMATPGKAHWHDVRWLLKYVKGSLNKGLMFGQSNSATDMVVGYVDSDFVDIIDTRESQTGYVFTIYGTAVSWRASLQGMVTLSTTEAEFVAVTEAVKEALWIKGVLGELGYSQDCIRICCDSQGAIHLSKHQVFHERSKHIDVKLHFVREVIETGAVQMTKIDTEDNPADMLTKPVPSTKFLKCLELIKLVETG